MELLVLLELMSPQRYQPEPDVPAATDTDTAAAPAPAAGQEAAAAGEACNVLPSLPGSCSTDAAALEAAAVSAASIAAAAEVSLQVVLPPRTPFGFLGPSAASGACQSPAPDSTGRLSNHCYVLKARSSNLTTGVLSGCWCSESHPGLAAQRQGRSHTNTHIPNPTPPLPAPAPDTRHTTLLLPLHPPPPPPPRSACMS